MSLINQMLKDLESRRASDDLAQRAVDGMGTAARRKQRKQNLLLLSLLGVIAVLAAISSYLLWQEKQLEVAEPAVAKPAASVTAKPVPTKPAEVAVVNQPQPAPAAPLVQKAPSRSIQETPAGMTKPEIVEDEPVVEQRLVTKQPVEPVREAPSAKIKKRMRPQSAEQLAEQQYQKGYAALQRGDRKGAEDAWREALRIDAKHSASRESLSILYLSQSRRIEAAEQLKQGLADDPGNNKLALLYARMQLDAEDMAGAVSTLENAMRMRQQNGDFYAFTAAIYQRQGDFEKSIAAYQAALKQQSTQSVWWMGLGISLEGAGKNKEALTAYQQAAKNGRLSLKLKQYVEARIKALEE